jgi:hypothetical protein
VFTAAEFCVVAVFGVGACDTDSTHSTSATTTAPAMTANGAPAASLVGHGCASYVQQVPSGPGSDGGMAPDSAVDAMSNNPMIHTVLMPVIVTGGNPVTVQRRCRAALLGPM